MCCCIELRSGLMERDLKPISRDLVDWVEVSKVPVGSPHGE